MSSEAWLLDLGDDNRAAVGPAELVHVLVETPRLFPVPGAVAPCRELFLWEGEAVPLANLADAGEARLIAIVAYGDDPSSPARHGAVRVTSVPRRCAVSDDDARPREAIPARLQGLAHAAFGDEHGVVPVLDLHALFDRLPASA